MADSNFDAEQQAAKLLREHAMEVKLVGGFMEVSPSEIIFLLDKIESLNSELEVERMRLVACGVAAQGHFEDCLEEYKSASLDDVLQLRAEYESSRKNIVEEPAPEGDNGDKKETFTVWLRNTGQCLVPDQDNTTIEVSLRDGTVQRGRANEFDWCIIGDGGDILHYRRILNNDSYSPNF